MSIELQFREITPHIVRRHIAYIAETAGAVHIRIMHRVVFARILHNVDRQSVTEVRIVRSLEKGKFHTALVVYARRPADLGDDMLFSKIKTHPCA